MAKKVIRYKRVRIKEDPTVKGRGTLKDLHVAVWEKANGPVPKGYVIHHIDFNKDNNDISNLQCMTNSEHGKLHRRLGHLHTLSKADCIKSGIAHRKVGPEGTAWCCHCQQFLPEEAFCKNKGSWNGLSDTCKLCRSKIRSPNKHLK